MEQMGRQIGSNLQGIVAESEAIKASTYTTRKDPSSILVVVGFWCEETNTFILLLGEATVTLDDVMVLGGFLVLGEPVRVVKTLEDELGDDEQREERV